MCEGEVVGDASLTIGGAASLAEATTGEVTFYGNPPSYAQVRPADLDSIELLQDGTLLYISKGRNWETRGILQRVVNPEVPFV